MASENQIALQDNGKIAQPNKPTAMVHASHSEKCFGTTLLLSTATVRLSVPDAVRTFRRKNNMKRNLFTRTNIINAFAGGFVVGFFVKGIIKYTVHKLRQRLVNGIKYQNQ